MGRLLVVVCVLSACGPSRSGGGQDETCDTPGAVGACYTGEPGTAGVGPCKKGTRTCTDQLLWSPCMNEVVPRGERCGDAVDNDCNGMTDENVDADGDGFTTCDGDCCDNKFVCTEPKLVNQGAFDAPGNALDDDCDGIVDNTQLLCDQGLASDSGEAMDYAKAMELCQTATASDRRWGVISAQFSRANGMDTPARRSHSIRQRFGSNVMARGGVSLVELSTGAAAGEGDSNPDYEVFQPGVGNGTTSPFPGDWFSANGNRLPNAPGCPNLGGTTANDPVMLTLQIRVPTNARSFSLDLNFFSAEFPEFTCSAYNDFFVVLLDSGYTGESPNPMDKNLAFYAKPTTMERYPVGVNLAYGNTGLFTQCVNGITGCIPFGTRGNISTCVNTQQLAGTGLDTDDPGVCNTNSKLGGGTGWLRTSGNVKPGEIIKLRIAIWDTADDQLDSIAIVDSFLWSVNLANPGTVIF